MLTKQEKIRKYVLILIKKYGVKLLNDHVKHEDVYALSNPLIFQKSDYSTQVIMAEFVVTIAPFLNERSLHNITSDLIKFGLKRSVGKNTFWRNSDLSKYFVAYEVIIYPTIEVGQQLPSVLRSHISKHENKLLSKMNNGYQDISNVFTGIIFSDAIKLMHNRLMITYPKKILKYPTIKKLKGDEFKEELQPVKKRTKKKEFKNPKKKLTQHPLSNTEEFQQLKNSIAAIIKRSTDADLRKAQGIQKVVTAIEENKSNEEILKIIKENEKNIIKNTGTGFYSFFNCGCCDGYYSTSHKRLDKIESMLEEKKAEENIQKKENISETMPLLANL